MWTNGRTSGLDGDPGLVVCFSMAVPSFLLSVMLRGLLNPEGYTAPHFHTFCVYLQR